MATLTSTLTLAQRAMLVQQHSLTVVGGNIANVNTEGYARQRVQLTAVAGLSTPSGVLSGGVRLARIVSMRDQFIENQFRRELAFASGFESTARHLGMIETYMGKLDDTGLEATLDRFWNSWQDLSNEPNSTASRAVVRETANGVINRLRNVSKALDDQHELVDREIKAKIERVNELMQQIANINSSPARGTTGQSDDRATIVMDELASLINAEFRTEADGTVTVFIAGISVVEKNGMRNIEMYRDENNDIKFQATGIGRAKVNVNISQGEVGSLMNILNDDILELRNRLDQVAINLVKEVNGLHINGYGVSGSTGVNFFNPYVTGIRDIALSDEIKNDLGKIAASSSEDTPNNDIAVAIANISSKNIGDTGMTINESLRTVYAWLGAKVQEANVQTETGHSSLARISEWRENVSGVSLDEEMTEMIKFQHAYNAAARMITVLDRMFESIISLK